jgi:hypothetical protein
MNAENDEIKMPELHIAPGFRVLLTNPYELILNDSRGSALILRDDDMKRPVMTRLFALFKRGSFTREELLTALNGSGRDDGPEILRLLLDQAVIVDDLSAVAFGAAPPLRVSVLGLPNLVQRLLADFGPALDIRTVTTGLGADLTFETLAAGLGSEETVVYLGPLDTALLERLNDLALERRAGIVPLLLLNSRTALIGPTVVPGLTPCLRELLLWMMNADLIPQSDPTSQVGLLGALDSGEPVAYRPLESLMLGFLGEMLLEQRRATAAGRQSNYAGRAVFINLERRLVTMDSVLRIPGCDRCAALTGANLGEEAIPAELVRLVQVEAASA